MNMIVNEIFTSIEGEGIRAGRLCTFIRFTGCNLRCSWCDTRYAFDEGREMSVREILDSVPADARCVTVTGGEPLLQKEAVLELCKELSDFDLCLYTGYEFSDVPEEIKEYLRCVKVGLFDQSKMTSVMPFVGSTNQKFMEVKHG